MEQAQPPVPPPGIDIGEAFGYVFKDGRWFSKVAMGALFVLLSMFLVGIPFLLGYMIWITRNVMRGEQYPLPEWTHLGQMFVDGLKLIATYIVFYIPFFIIVFVPFIIFFILGFVQMDPSFIVVFIGYYIFIIIASIAYALLLIPVYVRFAMTNSVGRSLAFGHIWEFFKKNFANILLILVMSWVAGIIGGLGVIVFFIGVFFTQAYAYMIQAHLMGQLENVAKAEGNGIMAWDKD